MALEPLDKKRVTERHLAGLGEAKVAKFWRIYSASRSRLGRQDLQSRRQIVRIVKDAGDDVEAAARVLFDAGGERRHFTELRRGGRYHAFVHEVQERLRRAGDQVADVLRREMLLHFKLAWSEAAFQVHSLTPKRVKSTRESRTITVAEAMKDGPYPRHALREFTDPKIRTGGISFDIPPDHAILAILDQPFMGAMFSERIGLITDDSAHQIQQKVAGSLMSGESWSSLARKLRDLMGVSGKASVYRAERIARTELSRARNLGASDFYDENDELIEKVIWVANAGACDECADLDGTEVDVDDEETLPPAASHPNCRCYVQGVPRDFAEVQADVEGEARGDRNFVGYRDFLGDLRHLGLAAGQGRN